MFHREGHKIILVATLFVGIGIIVIDKFIILDWMRELSSKQENGLKEILKQNQR